MAPFNTEAILAEHGDNNDNQGQCCESPKASVSQMALDRIRVQGHSAKLDLSMSNLTFVPVEEIKEHYGNPVTLDLSHNHISCLCPKFVSEWKEHLTRLDVSNNRITMLPDDLGSLSQLTYLDIHRNMVKIFRHLKKDTSLILYLNSALINFKADDSPSEHEQVDETLLPQPFRQPFQRATGGLPRVGSCERRRQSGKSRGRLPGKN